MSDIDPDVLKYYERYLDLFTHDGWKQFISDLSEGLASDERSATARCDTSEKWFEERGAQKKAKQILNFETMIRMAYEQVTNPDTPFDED